MMTPISWTEELASDSTSAKVTCQAVSIVTHLTLNWNLQLAIAVHYAQLCTGQGALRAEKLKLYPLGSTAPGSSSKGGIKASSCQASYIREIGLH